MNPKVIWRLWCEPDFSNKAGKSQWGISNYHSKQKAEEYAKTFSGSRFWTYAVKKFPANRKVDQ